MHGICEKWGKDDNALGPAWRHDGGGEMGSATPDGVVGNSLGLVPHCVSTRTLRTRSIASAESPWRQAQLGMRAHCSPRFQLKHMPMVRGPLRFRESSPLEDEPLDDAADDAADDLSMGGLPSCVRLARCAAKRASFSGAGIDTCFKGHLAAVHAPSMNFLQMPRYFCNTGTNHGVGGGSDVAGAAGKDGSAVLRGLRTRFQRRSGECGSSANGASRRKLALRLRSM